MPPLHRPASLLRARARQSVFLPLYRISRLPWASSAHGPATAFSTGAVNSVPPVSSTPVNSMYRRAYLPKQ
jgi:hypothetical protein